MVMAMVATLVLNKPTVPDVAAQEGVASQSAVQQALMPKADTRLDAGTVLENTKRNEHNKLLTVAAWQQVTALTAITGISFLVSPRQCPCSDAPSVSVESSSSIRSTMFRLNVSASSSFRMVFSKR